MGGADLRGAERAELVVDDAVERQTVAVDREHRLEHLVDDPLVVGAERSAEEPSVR